MNYKSNCFYRNCKIFRYPEKRNFYRKTYIATKKNTLLASILLPYI